LKRENVFELLSEANQATGHNEFVIIGSLSVLGVMASPPDEMVMSVDIDLYPAKDPGRASEIADLFGQESAFYRKNGFYADSKYVRGDERDRTWVRAGLAAGILSLATIEYRLRETVLEQDEREHTITAIAEDRT